MNDALIALATLVAATLSGAVGMGGGTLLVTVMASLISAPAVVPIHGVVQMVSNSSRGLLLISHVRWGLVGLYLPMQLVGVVLARELWTGGSQEWFRAAVGAFVLASVVWDLVRPQRLVVSRLVFALAGLGGGILTILVGVTGPYLSAFFLRDDLEKEEIVATKAAIQTVGHLSKIPVFLSLGFDYRQHLPLLLLVIPAALVGTWAGTRLLTSMRNDQFRWAFRGILSLLALRLLLGSA